MREIVEMESAAATPEAEALLQAQGAPPGTRPQGRTAELCAEALVLFSELAAPKGVFQEISSEDFARVYQGEGRNAERAPLAQIHPLARHLALFAVTMGPSLGERIDALFAARDFALAALLDAAASEGAERAADALESRYEAALVAAGVPAGERHILRYSPGYCGWHVSGQHALFAHLEPAAAGISLRASSLMEPLKSISGVLVSGSADIHDFTDDFEFCADCADRACRDRIARLSKT